MSQDTSQNSTIPRLQPPGAGLPLFQRIVLRYYWGPFVARRSIWDEDSQKFEAISAKTLGIADALSEERLQTRVLIPPQLGLEDSSRYWSVAMTLDHLMIVGRGLSQIVTLLSRGEAPQVNVDVAKVKPQPGRGPLEIRKEFREFAATAIPTIESSVKDRKSGSLLAHPWFGPMTAHQWHWLIAQHSLIHYHQVREIVRRI